MSSIRNVEQTSLNSKVLHIGLGIILATSLLPFAPNQLFADEVTNNKATTFTDQVTEATKTSQTHQVTDINQIPDPPQPIFKMKMVISFMTSAMTLPVMLYTMLFKLP